MTLLMTDDSYLDRPWLNHPAFDGKTLRLDPGLATQVRARQNEEEDDDDYCCYIIIIIIIIVLLS